LSAGAQIPLVLEGFVDANDNYLFYRTKLHVEPSLPFLYLLVSDYRRGNEAALPKIFSFLSYGPHLEGVPSKVDAVGEEKASIF
jgi:hypothetical protein